MKTKCFVFDIDGTVANLEHRRHFVRTKPANWNAFNKLMHMDKRIEEVYQVYKTLADNTNFKIVFLSGREGTKNNIRQTEDWLNNNDFSASYNINLFLRNEGDYRGDEIVKIEMLKSRVLPDNDVVAIFDDRPKVVRMWRENGFFVFDVNQSGEEF